MNKINTRCFEEFFSYTALFLPLSLSHSLAHCLHCSPSLPLPRVYASDIYIIRSLSPPTLFLSSHSFTLPFILFALSLSLLSPPTRLRITIYVILSLSLPPLFITFYIFRSLSLSLSLSPSSHSLAHCRLYYSLSHSFLSLFSPPTLLSSVIYIIRSPFPPLLSPPLSLEKCRLYC